MAVGDDEPRQALAARVEILERRVHVLEETVVELSRSLVSSDAAAPRAVDRQAPVASAPAPFHPSPPPLSSGRRGRQLDPAIRPTIAMLPTDPGQWVNRLGIALVLLGAAFGFKYSIDRGWIGPAVRVMSGLGLGAVMLFLSGRVRGARGGLSRILAGGGIACGYLSLYAAFHLYALVSHGSAFVAMSVVTAIALAISMRDDDAMSAIVGTVGGLATPLLLDNGSGSIGGLVGYTCLVVGGAGAVYARQGWTSLLSTMTAGGWIVFATAAGELGRDVPTDATALEVGIVFVALATWWLSVVRETLSAENPEAWRPASRGFQDSAIARGFQASSAAGDLDLSAAARGVDVSATTRRPDVAPDSSLFLREPDWPELPHQLTLATPIIVLFLSTLTWKLEEAATGFIALSLAIGWGLASLHLRRIPLPAAARLAATHAVAAAVMLAFSMSFLLGEEACRVGFAAEALALILLSSRTMRGEASPPWYASGALASGLLFTVVGFETFRRLTAAIGNDTPLTVTADLADLAVIVAIGVAARLQTGEARDIHFFAAQAGLLTWLLRVLGVMSGGAALVTASWFANAVVLVVAGLRSDSAVVRRAGAAVMALTMAKLFVIDMAKVDALWRIVTFLGFGGVLLTLGYAFPVLWKPDSTFHPKSPPD